MSNVTKLVKNSGLKVKLFVCYFHSENFPPFFSVEKLITFFFSPGKDLICLPQTKSMNLQNLCFNLRNVETNEKCKPGTQTENKTASQFIEAVTHSAFDLLVKMLDLNANTRITAEDALEHEYFK